MLVQVHPDYLSALLQYEEVLTQRNALLKNAQGNTPDMSVVSFYNEALVKHGTILFHYRKAGLAALEEDFLPIYHTLSGKDEHIDMVYHSDLLDNDYPALLENNLRKDLILEYTSKGPHRDDIKLVIDNNPAKKFASQGQQKSMLIALKLAQYRYLHGQKKEKPILLIDDIFDKLDIDRCKNLINLLNNDNFGQIFITDTDIARMKLIFKDDQREKHFFEVIDGAVTELNEGK
jgi:DNA replication and repair protein RecF